jgi:hypothetical protein
MEPPKTPEEQAELERAIADMLAGGETPRPRVTGIAAAGLAARVPQPEVVLLEDPAEQTRTVWRGRDAP